MSWICSGWCRAPNIRTASPITSSTRCSLPTSLSFSIFHAYPWLIHRLTYRRTNHHNLHVRGYKKKGNINTPMELAIQNQVDRFTLAIDAIDRVPSLQVRGAHAREMLLNRQIDCRSYA